MPAIAVGHRPGGHPTRAALEKTAEKVYYHGTRYRLRPGQVLEGGKFNSNQGYGQPAPDVYFSTDPQVARNFADYANGPDSNIDAKPRVYQVEPVGPIEVDPDEDPKFGSFRAKKARVVKEVRWATNLMADEEYKADGTFTASLEPREADADTDGVMVCLVPPKDVVEVLSGMEETTEPPENAHLTLLYLGSTADAGGPMGRERLYRAVYDFAIHSGYRALTGKVNGFGAFLNGEENVLWAAWDIPGIAEFRTHLVDYCRRHWVTLREDNHGFTPHQTLAYLDGPVTSLPSMPAGLPEQVVFGEVSIAWGSQWQSVPLP
jgi:2'-5' RNA ligase